MSKRILFTLLIAAILIVPSLIPSLILGQEQLQKTAINFPTRSGASWPMFIAKEGGYYQKYGLDMNLVFGAGTIGVAMISSGEAAMTNSSMEQALQAGSRDPNSLVLLGSTLNRGMFALMAPNKINSPKELKGKRVAVSQIGDAPYNYSVALLGKFGLKPRDVQWVPVGTDANARAVALTTGRAEATLLTAPAYFAIEKQGYKTIANMADYSDIYASTVYLFTRKTVAANPKLPEVIIKAHTEAIKRFYDDKAFAVKAYMVYDKQNAADVERIYDMIAKSNQIERIPYVMAAAIKSITDQANAEAATQLKDFDPHKVVDNSLVDRLVKEGFFEKIFGPGIKSEQEKKSKAAFR
jgi:ABC-type nitrate/sulfonate/bicarbonate transport system substrate-binding protein